MKKRIHSFLISIVLLNSMFSPVLFLEIRPHSQIIANFKVIPSIEQLGKIYLVWHHYSDTFCYRIYKDGQAVGITKTPFYVIRNLSPGKKYSLSVVAVKQQKEIRFSKKIEIKLPTKISTQKKNVEIKRDNIYINGQKYLICGVTYSPYRPGDSIFEPCSWNYRMIEEDFKRMQKAGFNTIRSYSLNTVDEYMLELATKYNLMVIQVLRVDFLSWEEYHNLQDFLKWVKETIQDEVEKLKEHSNILCYQITNKIPPYIVSKAGLDNTNKYLKALIDQIREIDPARPISLTNWTKTDILDSSYIDLVCTSIESWKDSHIQIMGHREYINWFKRNIAKNKPLLIDYGYSVSSSGEGNYGYGGNTEEIQAQGLVQNTYDLVSEGACGGTIFEWNDEWWKISDLNYGNSYCMNKEKRHLDDPEQWFGMVSIIDMKNLQGSPRLALKKMAEVYKGLIVNPRDGHAIKGVMPIEIYSSNVAIKEIKTMEYRLNDKNWISLNRKGNWWIGSYDTKSLKDGKYILLCRYIDFKNNIKAIPQKVEVYIANDTGLSEPKVIITSDKSIYKENDVVTCWIKVLKDGKPQKNIPIEYGFYITDVTFSYCKLEFRNTEFTNKDGIIIIIIEHKLIPKLFDQLQLLDKPYFLIIATKIDSELNNEYKYSERIVMRIHSK